jgi:hypothetical protein
MYIYFTYLFTFILTYKFIFILLICISRTFDIVLKSERLKLPLNHLNRFNTIKKRMSIFHQLGSLSIDFF